MRYQEIIEWNKIPPQNFPFPDMSKATSLGDCNTKIGILPVLLKVNSYVNTYALGDVAYLELEEWTSGYFTARTAMTSLPGNGLVQTLLEWIIRHRHLKIFSDFEMSDAGEAMWLSLMISGLRHSCFIGAYVTHR